MPTPKALPTSAPAGSESAAPRLGSPAPVREATLPAADAPVPASTAAADVAGAAPFHLGHRLELDGLRGVAVLLVFVYHIGRQLWPGSPVWMLHGGFLGVDLFFVLSGFLITSLLLEEAGRRDGRVALGSFAGRRLRRLVPVLVGLLGALLAVALAGKMYDPRVVRSSALSVLTFSHNWAITEGWEVEFGHLWSVAVEAQFYALWALVVVVALRTRRPHAVLASAAGAGIVAVAVWRSVQFNGGETPFDLYVSTDARLDAPLVGSLAGVVASAGWLPWFRGRVAAAAGSLGLALLVVESARESFMDGALYRGLFTAIALCAAVSVLAAVRATPGPLRRALSVRPLVAAGLISYSLYVWHLPIFQMLSRNTRPWQPQPRAVVGVVVSLAVAVLSYRFVERPFLRRRAGVQANPKGKQRSPSSPNAYMP